MRRLLIVALASSACGPSTPRDDPPSSAPAHPVRATKSPLEPFTGAHGGVINLVAVTQDGHAAVTADATGGLRLWPTLDGTREPVVVRAAAAVALAIAPDDSGFAIAVTDAADHVELIRVDPRGHVRSRNHLGAAVQLELVAGAALALRADQVLEQIAFDGTLRGRLAADAGSRILTIAVRDTQAIAIIATERVRRARWLELGTLAWGQGSLPLPIGDGAIAISPDGQAIAANDAKTEQVVRVELATGRTAPACPTAFLPRGETAQAFLGSGVAPMALGYVGDTQLACLVDGRLAFFDSALDRTVSRSVSVETGFAAANDRILVPQGHQLGIHTPDHVDYLGYGLRDITQVRSVPTGLMIGKGDQEPVLLDDQLRERARFTLPKLPVSWTDLVPIDDRYIATMSTRADHTDLWGSAYDLKIYDTVKQTMHQALPYRARTGELIYEPATRLLVTSDGNKTVLLHFDPRTHSLVDEVVLETEAVPTRIALLDPALAGGLIALAIHDEDGGMVVWEIHGGDLPARSEERDGRHVTEPVRPRRRYRLAGDLLAVDRAGRIYLHDVRYVDEIGVYVGGAHHGSLTGAVGSRLRPSPDGELVVTINNDRIALYTPDGHRRWETVAWGSSDVDWMPSGILFARFTGALARIDDQTGALEERQCGWAFGISTTSRDSTATAPSVCDVAP